MPDDAAKELAAQFQCCLALVKFQDDLEWDDVWPRFKHQAANWQRSVNKIAGQGASLS